MDGYQVFDDFTGLTRAVQGAEFVRQDIHQERVIPYPADLSRFAPPPDWFEPNLFVGLDCPVVEGINA